jgi:holliday junction DNA helicase RuvA
MIAFVRGRVVGISGEVVVVDMGALGINVHCTDAVIRSSHVGAPIDIPATLIVREDSMTVFGFADSEERSLFDLLQTVSGVGPRVALAILSTLGADRLRSAIAAEDLAVLTSVSGVGKKGAERMVVELRDKVTAVPGVTPRSVAHDGWQSQVRTGLLGLGWAPRDADAAIASVETDDVWADAVSSADVAVLLRAALRGLDRA